MWVGEDEEEGGDGWREIKTERGRATGFQPLSSITCMTRTYVSHINIPMDN